MRAVSAAFCAVALALGSVVFACSSETNTLGGRGASSGATGDEDSGHGTGSSSGSTGDGGSVQDASKPDPPKPDGCIQDVTPGDHVYTCNGLQVNAAIPEKCMAPGCGLIVEIHGDTGTGLLMDAHTNLFALGKARGYVVISPTGPPWPGGPGSTWSTADDANVVAIVKQFAQVFRVDAKRVHATGFSRGGFVAWRLLCDHADLFASVAPATAGSAPGGTCAGGAAEVSCPFDATRSPSRQIPVLFLIGRTDTPVPYGCTSRIRDQAIAKWGLGTPQTVASDAQYTHQRWTNAQGGLLETFEHSYETVPDGPWGSAKGHCFPGSKMDPYAPQYAVPCKGPNAFTWGEEVMKFFEAHPSP